MTRKPPALFELLVHQIARRAQSLGVPSEHLTRALMLTRKDRLLRLFVTPEKALACSRIVKTDGETQ